MSERLYQILYCSRNNLVGSEADMRAQVEEILVTSRRNNASDGITGALFFNTIFFAQVLEGPFADVQRVFERLQLDTRHSDLVVLQSGYVFRRDFEGWWMACADTSPNLADVLIPERLSGPSTRAESILAALRAVVLNGEDWALPERRAGNRSTSTRQAVSA